MASYYSAEYTDAFIDVPSEKVDVNKWHGRLRVLYGSYSLSADLSASDKIYIGKLPKGCRIYEVTCAFADLDAAGGTIDVGYEYNESSESSLVDDPNAFLNAVDVTSADTVQMSDEANFVGFGYETEGLADILVTVSSDTDATSGTIKVAVWYAMD